MFTRATQCVRGVLDPPVSAFSLSLYRHPFLYTLFSSRFTLIINNNHIDQSLNDAAADKIRKYRADYNNRTPSVVSCIPPIPSTSVRLHTEFVRLLFLQAHRETDRFFTGSGVHSTPSDRDQFHFLRTTFLQELKTKLVWLFLRHQCYVLILT
jgi:hypothetical protein